MISSGLKHTNTDVDTKIFQRGVSLIKAGTHCFGHGPPINGIYQVVGCHSDSG